MSNSVFGPEYADQYDLLYGDKNYEAECDLLDEVFRRYSTSPVHSVLDLGCGTGNHAIPLSRRGYHVTGVDRSSEMLAIAQRKSGSNLPIFIEGDVRSVDLGQGFDAVLMMFAVLGYQLTNEDILSALQTVRRHLKQGGLFVCDVWYGPAVLAIRPTDRVKIIPTHEGKVIRIASGSLDTYHHLSKVRYHLLRLSGKQVLSDMEEIHEMRYFFPQELAFLMTQTQMQILSISAFGDLTQLPTEDTWNVLVVGKST